MLHLSDSNANRFDFLTARILLHWFINPKHTYNGHQFKWCNKQYSWHWRQCLDDPSRRPAMTGRVSGPLLRRATPLNGGQPNFARCLAVSWPGTLYIHFWELTEFCQVQYSLCVQVLRSSILTALSHGTCAAGVSQILWRGARNGITELSLIVCAIYISQGNRHVGHRPAF